MGQVLLVRHGQASFGAADYDVLSETGWAQGEALGAWLRASGSTPTALVRGGMRRQRETLEAMAAACGWPLDDVVVDADWDEFDHVGLVGALPDLPADLDHRAFQEAFERATSAWIDGTHGGDIETWSAFVTRVRGALVRATTAAGSGETVVVVTSGGVIAAACAALLDPETDDPALLARLWNRLNTVIANGSVTRVIVGRRGARLLTFNDHSFLTDQLRTFR